MGLFGFGKKKKKQDTSEGSARKRRMISSVRSPVVRPDGQRNPGAAPSTEAPKQAVSAVEAKRELGQLKRGDSSALNMFNDTSEADNDLKDFIISSDLGEPEKVEEAFNTRSEEHSFIKLLVEGDIVNENDLLVELSKKCMIPQGRLDKYKIRKKALECLDAEISKKLYILPVDKLGQILSVAMVNPLNQKAVKTLSDLTGLRVKTVVCTYSGFMDQYKKHYVGDGSVEGSEESLDISVEEPEPISPDEFKKSIKQASKPKAASIPPPPPMPAAPVEAEEPQPIPIGEVIFDHETESPVEVVDTSATTEVLHSEAGSFPAEGQLEVPEIVDVGFAGDPVVEEIAEIVEEQILEPIIEGIDMSDDEDEAVTLEPVIISAEVIMEPIIEDVEIEEGKEPEYVDAVAVVEEEFNQGIRLGSIDLFKKWESLHRKQRIITLKQIPDEIFSFVVA